MSLVRTLVAVASLLLAASSPAAAQGKSKQYKVGQDRALVVTREVLVKQGFEVVKVEDHRDYQVVWYRAGNRGRGRGKGPMESMIIRKVRNEIVFERAPAAILVDIDVKLRL
jgi:CO dehydrogenase/acetyl-CoA synthase alpha subunit